MNNADLTYLREQLLAAQQAPDPSGDEPPQWGQARSPQLPLSAPTGGGAATAPQTEAVQALRQRSPQATRPSIPEAAAPGAPTIPLAVNQYLRRLHTEAEQINDLYRQQEAAIQKFQRTVKGLDIVLLRQPDGVALKRQQFCELRSAALTSVMQDEAGRYVLTAIDFDLMGDEQQAFQAAAEIRALGQPRSQTAGAMWRSLNREPVTLITGLWHALTGTLEHRTPLTPLDILIWGGGGVIGRMMLDLALAAIPGLWPWVIASVLGAVALGLYRLLFSRQPDVAFIARLFLALVGLGIGGKL